MLKLIENILGLLFNIYSFFSLYSNIDGFKFKEKSIPLNKRHELDQWILSELHKLIREVDHSYNNYEPTKASRLITTYVQELLSNWYVRLSRRRFWKGEYNSDKISAFQTLFECLITILKISSPISPFFLKGYILIFVRILNTRNLSLFIYQIFRL